MYIADTGNQRIRKISNGVIIAVAGGGPTLGGLGDNGPATSALLNYPFGVAVDPAGNLYIEDTLDQRIRKVSNGIITTIAGGGSTPALIAKSAGAFAATGSMSRPRIGHTATLLGNGKVLIAGGFEYPNVLVLMGSEYPPSGSAAIATSELYDPGTATFAPTGSMNPPLGYSTATLLADGRVLIVGAPPPYKFLDVAGAQLYDPSTGAFTSVGNLINISRPVTATLRLFTPTGRIGGHYTPSATLLPNGNALIAEGSCDPVSGRSELYDTSTGTFSPAPGSLCINIGEAAILLPNGNVLIKRRILRRRL